MNSLCDVFSFVFWENSWLDWFAFEINWPLECLHYFTFLVFSFWDMAISSSMGSKTAFYKFLLFYLILGINFRNNY